MFFAWRGRRIDNHPLCRRCQFDLVGLPPGAERCSECGANLTRRRATRIGHRRTARIWLLLGLSLVLGDGGWLSIRAHQFLTQNDLSSYKPVWWLLINARSSSPQERDPAFSRLLQLLREKKLKSSQSRSVVALILAAQADPKRAWQKDWGCLIEDLHEQHVVLDEEWNTYWRQGWSLKLYLRQNVSRDGPLPVILSYLSPPKDSGRYLVDPPLLYKARIGDISLDVPQVRSRVSRSSYVGLPPEIARLKDGPQIVQATVRIPRTLPHAGFFRFPKELEPLDIPLQGQFTLFPSDQTTVAMVSRPELESQLIKCIGLKPITVKRRKGGSEQNASCTISVNNPPVDIAFSVWIRQGGAEWPIGRVVCWRFERQECPLEGPANALEGPEAELILRPDPSAGTSTTHVREIWGDELVIEKVPVQAPVAPAPAPAQSGQ